MDGDLTLLHDHIELLLDLVLQVDDCLSCDAVEDASIIRWGQQLKVAISAHLQDEHIQDGHLFDVVIEEPQHIVKPIVLSV